MLNALTVSHCLISSFKEDFPSPPTQFIQTILKNKHLKNLAVENVHIQLKSQTWLYYLLTSVSVFLRLRSFSIVDPSDTFILRVKWRFEVSFGLVRHSHPLHGELATLYEISTHLIEKDKTQSLVKQNVGGLKTKKKGKSSNENQNIPDEKHKTDWSKPAKINLSSWIHAPTQIIF